METAVTEFLCDVSRFLTDAEAGGWEVNGSVPAASHHRQQLLLDRLRRQLQQLVQLYPSLQPDVAEEELYDETGDPADLFDAITSGVGATRDADAGSGDSAGQLEQQQIYHDTELPVVEDSYDDITGTQPYVPMFKTGLTTAINSPSYGKSKAGRAPELPPPSKPAPTPLSSSDADAGSTLSVNSARSASSAGSHESGDGVAAQPAAQLRSVASRWGRLELRQNSILRPYRRFWGGVAGGRLVLYQRETDATHRLSVSLAGYEVRRPPPAADVKDKHRPVCFELVRPGCRTLTLLALTAKDARQWMAALERAAAVEAAADAIANVPAAGERPAASTGAPESRPQPPPPPAALGQYVSHEPIGVDGDVDELLYNEPEDEEQIYADVPLPDDRPKADADGVVEEDIYESISSPTECGSTSPWRWAPGTRLPPPPSIQLPELPPQRPLRQPSREPDKASRSPRPPVRLPPSQPAPRSAPLPPPPSSVPPPPPRARAPTPAEPLLPPRPPARQPSPPPVPPSLPSATMSHSPPTAPAVDDIYDEMVDPTGDMYDEMAPPCDPFYNVLEAEAEYLRPPHASPVPFRTAAATEEPPDEGYGNSSAGSEPDYRTVVESHYKALPLAPPVPVATAPADRAGGRCVNSPASVPPAAAPSDGRSDGSPASKTSTRAGLCGEASVAPPPPKPAGTSGVRAAIERLNRQSVGDADDVESTPRQTSISSELAKKQAIIAGAVRSLASPATSGLPCAARPATPCSGRPAVLPPKPSLPAGSRFKRPSDEPGPGRAVRPTARDPQSEVRSRAGEPAGGPTAARVGTPPLRRPPAPGGPALVPNKSAVYNAMLLGESRQQGAAQSPTEPEEDEIYAEIGDAHDEV